MNDKVSGQSTVTVVSSSAAEESPASETEGTPVAETGGQSAVADVNSPVTDESPASETEGTPVAETGDQSAITAINPPAAEESPMAETEGAPVSDASGQSAVTYLNFSAPEESPASETKYTPTPAAQQAPMMAAQETSPAPQQTPAAAAPEAPVAVLKPSWYYLIFAASGFAGLIYESIWARYLKLLLGHAAYAQALVLAIFLFGLAVGAFLCARFSERISRPLLWYVGVEIIVALLAVYFHEIYVAARDWATGFVLLQIESDLAAEWFKWLLGAALIFPQSVLLGATFPLMSAGLVRLWPEASGRIVSLLYFSNSLGAAFGVLASAFLFIPQFGLPGTVAFAGLINSIAATAVWVLGHRYDDVGEPLPPRPAAAAAPGAGVNMRLLILLVAFGTGVASFVYEIVWVRMLSLLFGASTHAFELMLAAFILGLAIGGLVVHRRADRIGEPLAWLAMVQLCMGVFAMLTLFAFPLYYEFLNDFLAEIPRDEENYRLFIGVQIGLSLLMMLPATICAGMTLPLLTKRLMNDGGETAIGSVYAANTVGAIVGVFLALHILLPNFGMQPALLVGGALDMALGIALLAVVARPRLILAIPGALMALLVMTIFGRIDPAIAAAGVFRQQRIDLATQPVVYYQDGKTASIAVIETEVNNTAYPGLFARSIKTNGKVDASLYTSGTAAENGFVSDEMTMILAGLYPLLFKPDAKLAMNIGFGSGLTSRALLSSPTLQQLDNIEIEPKMVEGAQHLGERVAPVFSDRRNRFIFNDAKTVLARARQQYDIIVSEPSNPWISGVANLFTREFYQSIRSALREDGIFIQWLPLYETNPRLVASVVQALAEVFGDFNIYVSSHSDLIFVITPAPQLPPMLNAVFADDAARKLFSGYSFQSTADAHILLVGGKELMLPYFRSFQAPTNSDYYPYLESNAGLAFFQNFRYVLNQVRMLPVPIFELAGGESPANEGITATQYSALKKQAAAAAAIYNARYEEDGEIQQLLVEFEQVDCPLTESSNVFLEKISTLVSKLMPMTSAEKMTEVWTLLATNSCVADLLASDDTVAGAYTQFWRALSERDSAAMVRLGELLLPYAELQEPSGQTLLLATMAGHYHLGNYQRVLSLLHDLPLINPATRHAAQLLAANAAEKI